MVTSKWAIALVGVLAIGVLSIGPARADGTCKEQISNLEKRIAELEEIIGRTPTRPVQVKACNDRSVDLRSAAIGFKCRTSKGSIFERVAKDHFGEAWKGPDGLIWGDYFGEDFQDSATTTCKNLGGTLPSRADFARGEANGFREVLPNMKNRWFWSSSGDPHFYDLAAAFNGSNGRIVDDFFTYYSHSVRCAGR